MMASLAAPVGTRFEQPLTHSEILEPPCGDNRRKFSDEKRARSFDYEDDVCYKHPHFDDLQRSVEYKSHRERRMTPTSSEESHDRKLRREHHRDKHLNQKLPSVDRRHGEHSYSNYAGRDGRSYHTDGSISGVDNAHNSNDRYDEAKDKKHYRRDKPGSDSSWSRHQIQKERGVKRKTESDVNSQHRHHSHLSGLETSSSADHKKRSKDVNPGPVLRESRERVKPLADEFYRDRRQMVKVSDEDCIEGHRHKRKKRSH